MNEPAPASSPPLPPSNAGRWTVVGMLTFGVVMVLTMWVYWELYTRPFRPLQYAIADAYPNSSPQVVGGRYKSHKQGAPNTLRVVVHIPLEGFDPSQDEAMRDARALALIKLAAQYHDLDAYDQIEIRLVQVVPERELRHWTIDRPVAEWRELLKHD